MVIIKTLKGSDISVFDHDEVRKLAAQFMNELEKRLKKRKEVYSVSRDRDDFDMIKRFTR
jgi:hypothetical protein